MDIAEMHVWFRQYAQQMGMQNVRAILPEQIDIFINTSISDILNQLIRENIGEVNDRIITDNAKLNQINVLRTLYKVVTIPMSPAQESNTYFTFKASDRKTGKMSSLGGSKSLPEYLFLVDFALNYKLVSNNSGYGNSSKELLSVQTPNQTSYFIKDVNIDSVLEIEVYDKADTTFKVLPFVYNSSSEYLECIDGDHLDYKLYIATREPEEDKHYNFYIVLDLDDESFGDLYNPAVVTTINYDPPSFDEDALETNYFPVRIIKDSYLADTLNDFVLKNRLRSPIIVTYNNGIYDLYIDEFFAVNKGLSKRYVLAYNLLPYNLRMSYIAKPAKVKYAADLGGENVDCDLPESIHVDILKHAVDLYNTSITGSLYNQQQQQQVQNRETARNEARPQNEGYSN